eukprot:Plantae.Rhodophyta-Rhodochaete_pulchella.ctg32264.p1 GENE.Plantae.Rhodophyta-Rhodochaete_pulchella.ctg32264~~Plantae.Rhodophyta-Rhodochaete_pulchella.ctg32264.p1  ORF type:complete len:287 (+),score=44.34 Plantae.Rhodophyta-Rhodochaete_pulchella.ctg32264:25-861(+)
MEKGPLWPGQAMSLEIDEVLHRSRSKYQDVLVFRSKTYGRVLVLDGVIQCTERDEFSYQEMIAHLPLYSHPCPERVLVVGGGDSGVMREVVRHPDVKEAVLCEIDEVVVDVSRKFLPGMSCGLDDPRVTVHIGDGAKYMDEHENYFDVIITDSSDPIGPAQVLFQPPFYKSMNRALREGGIVCAQGECVWLHLDLIRPMMQACRTLFPTVEYAFTTIPTYPSGQIGFLVCSKSDKAKLSEPLRTPGDDIQAKLRYYSPAVHRAAFVLPEFARRAIQDS